MKIFKLRAKELQNNKRKFERNQNEKAESMRKA